MAYDYQNEWPKLFTEAGMRTVLAVERNARRACEVAGVVRFDRATQGLTGDSWLMLAACDYLCETGRMRDVSRPDCMGQDRVFTVSP